jgi:hypothetical protein
VATGRTFLPDPQFPQWKRQIVINDDHVACPSFTTLKNSRKRRSAVVHVRLRFNEYRGLPAEQNPRGNESRAAPFFHSNAVPFGNAVYNMKADVVISVGVFFARIAETDH